MKRHGYTVKIKRLVTGHWSWFAKRSYGETPSSYSGEAIDEANAIEICGHWIDNDLQRRALALVLNPTLLDLLEEHPTRCRQLRAERRSIAQAAL